MAAAVGTIFGVTSQNNSPRPHPAASRSGTVGRSAAGRRNAHHKTAPLPKLTRGLSPLLSLAVLCAALLTGALLSIYQREIGWIYSLCFAAGAIITVATVKPRGLFLSVVQAPLLCGLITPLTQWLVGTQTGPIAQRGTVSTASLATASYSLVTFFPVLASVTGVCALIGALRYVAASTAASKADKRQSRLRHTMAAAEKDNVDTTRRAREMAGRNRRARGERQREVTVSELMRRQAATRSTQAPSHTRLNLTGDYSRPQYKIGPVQDMRESRPRPSGDTRPRAEGDSPLQREREGRPGGALNNQTRPGPAAREDTPRYQARPAREQRWDPEQGAWRDLR